MKNVVECPREFIAYFKALETTCANVWYFYGSFFMFSCRILFCKIQVRLLSCRFYPLWHPWHKVKLKFACPLSFSESNWSKYFRLYWLLWPWKGFLNLVRVWCQVWIQQRVLKEQRSSAHWTYFIKLLSNYNTQSLYHFKNSVILAQKLILLLFILSNH